MIATKILITWRHFFPLPSHINNELHCGPSQTLSLLLLWGKIIVCDSFIFNHLRRREWKKWGALWDQCVCVYTVIRILILKWRITATEKGEGWRESLMWIITYRLYKRRGPGWKGLLELFQQQGFVLRMFTVFKAKTVNTGKCIH